MAFDSLGAKEERLRDLGVRPTVDHEPCDLLFAFRERVHTDRTGPTGPGAPMDMRVIVQHYTASNTFASAYATFASDTPDPELGELPGVCSHFVIDRDGTIYQLVRLDTLCRHAVGLNWTAFGIEHVGTSARQVLANRAQLSPRSR